MGGPEYNLTGEAVRHIAGAVRFGQRFSRETVNRADGKITTGPFTPASVVWPVVVTGGPPGGSEELSSLYVGTVYYPNPTGDPVWLDRDCWVRPIPDQVLAEGDKGMGRLVGWRPEDGTYEARPIYAIVPSSSGSDSAGCTTGFGWTAGLQANRCLRATIAGAGTIQLSSGDGLTWASGEDDNLTICGTEFSVTFAKGSGGALPTLTLTAVGSGSGSGSGGSYTGTPDCAGRGPPPYAVFAFSRSELCPEGVATDACNDIISVRVECIYCAGWYCVADTDADPDATCDDGPRTVVYVDVDDDTSELIVCSGPYDSFEEATLACNPGEDPETLSAECDSDDPVNTLGVLYRGPHGTAVGTGTGGGTGYYKFAASPSTTYRVTWVGYAAGFTDPSQNFTITVGASGVSGITLVQIPAGSDDGYDVTTLCYEVTTGPGDNFLCVSVTQMVGGDPGGSHSIIYDSSFVVELGGCP
jgi:hypothetical protein